MIGTLRRAPEVQQLQELLPAGRNLEEAAEALGLKDLEARVEDRDLLLNELKRS